MIVYTKTERGVTEITQRSLSMKRRRLLIMVDGRRDDTELAKLTGFSDVAESLAELAADGFITPIAVEPEPVARQKTMDDTLEFDFPVDQLALDYSRAPAPSAAVDVAEITDPAIFNDKHDAPVFAPFDTGLYEIPKQFSAKAAESAASAEPTGAEPLLNIQRAAALELRLFGGIVADEAIPRVEQAASLVEWDQAIDFAADLIARLDNPEIATRFKERLLAIKLRHS